MKIGMLGQHTQLGFKNFQRLLRNRIRHNVVDRYLHMIEAGFVQPFDAFRHQHVAVRNHSGDGTGFTNLSNHIVQVGMQQWFTARNRDHRSP